jgi:hypothetical protein
MPSDGSDGSVDARGGTCMEAGATDPGASLIPLGAYRSCAASIAKWHEGIFGSVAPLTLTEDQGTLMVDLGDPSGVASGSLAFAPITANDAVIMPGQTYGTQLRACATVTITAGALTLDGDTLVVLLIGEGCGDWISGMFSCTVPTAPTGTIERPPPCSATPPPCACGEDGWPAFPVGVYGECTEGVPLDAAGNITFTENQGGLTAAFDGVGNIAPMDSLSFTPTTDKTATVAPSQTLDLLEASRIPGLNVHDPMTIASGSLVVSDSTVFVFLRGSNKLGEQQELFHCTAGK